MVRSMLMNKYSSLVKSYLDQMRITSIHYDENEALFLATLQLAVPQAFLKGYCDQNKIPFPPEPRDVWVETSLVAHLRNSGKEAEREMDIGLEDTLEFLDTLDISGGYLGRTDQPSVVMVIQERRSEEARREEKE
jgi:hypothetical protein